MSVNVTQLLDRPRLDQPRSAAHSAPAAHPSPSEAPRGPVEGRDGPVEGRAGPGAPVRPRAAWRAPETAGETPWQVAWLAC